MTTKVRVIISDITVSDLYSAAKAAQYGLTEMPNKQAIAVYPAGFGELGQRTFLITKTKTGVTVRMEKP